MKLSLSVLIVAVFGCSAFCENAIPKKWDKERYSETVAASPFVLETPKVDVEVPKEPEKMFVNLISNVDGKPYVVMQEVGGSDPMRFILGEKGEEGITVTDVKMGDRFLTSEVEIEQNGKKRWIKFNESQAAASPARPPAAVNPRTLRPPSITPTMNPGGAVLKNTNPTIPRPTNAPSVTVPRPGTPGAGGPPSYRTGGGRDRGPSSSSKSSPQNTGPQRTRVRSINNR